MTLDTETYERQRARLDAALRDAQSRGDIYLESDVQDALIDLENELNRLTDDEKEEAGNAQLKILREVLQELREKAGTFEYPGKYHWVGRGNYTKFTGMQGLEVWHSGCRGDRDQYVYTWPYEIMTDLEKFRTEIRAEALPLFNELRRSKREQLERNIAYEQQKLAELQGNIN